MKTILIHLFLLILASFQPFYLSQNLTEKSGSTPEMDISDDNSILVGGDNGLTHIYYQSQNTFNSHQNLTEVSGYTTVDITGDGRFLFEL